MHVCVSTKLVFHGAGASFIAEQVAEQVCEIDRDVATVTDGPVITVSFPPSKAGKVLRALSRLV